MGKIKIDWKRKLCSRKLWAAAAGIIADLAIAFGLDENTINAVAGAVVSAASVAAYILAERKRATPVPQEVRTTVEDIARNELGMAAPGEKIFRFSK